MIDARRDQRPSTPEEQPVSMPQAQPVTNPLAEEKTAGSPSESWRELAQRIQKESDPNVMIELTQELMAKLDAEKARKQGRKNK